MEGWLCQVMEELNFQVQDFRLTGRHAVLIAVSWGRYCFRSQSGDSEWVRVEKRDIRERKVI